MLLLRDLLLNLGVYGARRLIEYQNLRVEGERPCKAHELTLTDREGSNVFSNVEGSACRSSIDMPLSVVRALTPELRDAHAEANDWLGRMAVLRATEAAAAVEVGRRQAVRASELADRAAAEVHCRLWAREEDGVRRQRSGVDVCATRLAPHAKTVPGFG